ncbi:MAG: DUF4331 family protein [Candidatus Eremiobacteraeota bacterium]|nr:DUF4331 family protein [Candidatus Eremiobacteraeota bacterium]
MTRVRTWAALAALAGICGLAIVATIHPVRAYQDSFATINKPGADIADTYFFPSPSNPQNVVAIMTVHPLIPAGQGGNTFFDQSVLYQMKFDTTIGTAGHIPKENFVIQFSFGPVISNKQSILIYGPGTPNSVGTTNTLLAETATGTVGKAVSVSSSVTVWSGPAEDPAFYDRNQLLRIFPDRNRGSTAASCLTTTCPQGFNNPGSDSQGNMNVLAIVVEMPRASLIGPNGNTKVAYWATTSSETGT